LAGIRFDRGRDSPGPGQQQFYAETLRHRNSCPVLLIPLLRVLFLFLFLFLQLLLLRFGLLLALFVPLLFSLLLRLRVLRPGVLRLVCRLGVLGGLASIGRRQPRQHQSEKDKYDTGRDFLHKLTM